VPPRDPETANWFDQEVRPHEAGLRAWLQSRFSHVADPDDLMQESYMRLIRARATGAVLNTKAFLFATARNAAFDIFRRSRVITMEPLISLPASSVEGDACDVAEAVSRSQEIEILHESIQALPPRCREIMTLQKMHGLSNREVAERLGISINTVNAQIVIGLARCRRFLRERGVLRGHQQ
jgi:RNA polymerase sigma-70 factor (ECF subfamily)